MDQGSVQRSLSDKGVVEKSSSSEIKKIQMSKPLSFGSLRSISVLDGDEEKGKNGIIDNELKITYDVDPSCKSRFVCM